jgi:hypothetical protein
MSIGLNQISPIVIMILMAKNAIQDHTSVGL